MIADGLDVYIFALLKLKFLLVRLLGFKDASLVPTSSGRSFYVRFSQLTKLNTFAYPCLDNLMPVLDASFPFELAPAAMGGPYAEDEMPVTLLIGSAFVDVVLDVFVQLQDLAFLHALTLKNLLKTLLIVIYKHDFDSKSLRHLHSNLRTADRKTLDLLLAERYLSYELRQLALSICQAFIKRWPYIIGNFLWCVVFTCHRDAYVLTNSSEAIEAAAKLLVSLNYEQNGDDVLVAQAKAFLETVLTMCAFFVTRKGPL